jgi:hypothetical protein
MESKPLVFDGDGIGRFYAHANVIKQNQSGRHPNCYKNEVWAILFIRMLLVLITWDRCDP